jgi:hypothetical protein
MLKSSNSYDENTNSNVGSDLTLKTLVLRTKEPVEKMKWLAIAVDSVYGKKI